MLDVPRELVAEVATLLRAERRIRGTRTGSRALTCWYQALLVLAWFRNQGDVGRYSVAVGERDGRPVGLVACLLDVGVEVVRVSPAVQLPGRGRLAAGCAAR